MNVIDEKPEDEEEEKNVMESESKRETQVKCTKKRSECEDLRPICHGWLIVCEGTPTKMMNKEVKLPWHAGYCVFDPRQSTMSCYKQEYPFVTNHFQNRMLHRNRTVRMDGDRSTFAKHWGILPEQYGPPITGPHTIARSYTRHPKERIPTKERFFSISRIPSRLTKFSTVRGAPVEFFATVSVSSPATSSTLKPRSPIERRVSASSHSSTGSMHRQGVHPNALHHLLLVNKKRSNTTTCAHSTPSTPRSSSAYSSGSTTSSIPIYVNTQAMALAEQQLPKAEKRVSFKDLSLSGRLPTTAQQPSSLSVQQRTGGGLHARKLHRCDTGDMSILERYLSRENMHTPSPIPLEYQHHQSQQQPLQSYSPRHVHFAQAQSRRPFQRDQRDETASIRKRLSRSCDHLSDNNFSPRLPPIRRKPTKHVPSTLSLVIHGTLFGTYLLFLIFLLLECFVSTQF